MESLQASRMFCRKASLNIAEHPLKLGVARKRGFATLRRKTGIVYSLTLRKSVAESNEGGIRSSQDGSSIVEHEKDDLILGTERDTSGSIIGFHVMPQSGIFFPLICYALFSPQF